MVHSAGVQDRDGARRLLRRAVGWFPRLSVIFADAAYAGRLERFAAGLGGWLLWIVRRPKASKGFVVLARRWVVERTFAWLNRYRRLSKDYETYSCNSETMIHLAMIHLMVRRIRPGSPTS